MCFWGAKILHHRSVEMAIRKSVKIGVGSSLTFKIGTEACIENGENKMGFENQQVLAINSHEQVDHIYIPCTDSSEGFKAVASQLENHKLSWPQVLASAHDGKKLRIMYTSDKTHLNSIRNKLSGAFEFRPDPLSSVSLTCYGSVGSDLASKVLQKMKTHGISVEKIIPSALTLSFFLSPDHREEAIRVAHHFVEAK
jgi:aspartate kinase